MSRLAYSYVVDAHGSFGHQAHLLTRALLRFGGAAPEEITAHLVNGTGDTVERSLGRLGIRTRRVEPFGHPYCNKIQQLATFDTADADHVVLLDTDTFVLSPLVLPRGDAILGKMVDAPNPPADVLRKVFAVAGLRMEPEQADVVAGPTARANFNGGLYVVPRRFVRLLSEAWARWAHWSLAHVAVFGPWAAHVDQVSFALAVAEQGLPVGKLPRRFNTPTHLGPQPAVETPLLLHYHDRVDGQGLLLPTGDPVVDGAVAAANAAIGSWISQTTRAGGGACRGTPPAAGCPR